ncbi:uncharacterized protein K452DRAFT_247919 [Aplosporella prunicola CBS 121167]|uniref:Uncharacterized protein n=1 Tax=Aplosporella prunicola CBS 121167 TaxID=1176127 RepID=A0A6A6BGW9_9PEZI|nr:uncharacterized protein K452DRAFT_247919 [Aplosporella prunicola CBS 121167]KAF2143389.1 hypothetical protein K452DRAFT_247919 [Aplosporella prunicola CBS 121167]
MKMDISKGKHPHKDHSTGYPTHSHLLSSGASKIFAPSSILHPQRAFTARLNAAEQRSSDNPEHQDQTAASSSKTGEHAEHLQTSPSEGYTPDLAKSVPLEPNRQSLIEDIIALYSCQPTVQRVKRYNFDCVYDDHFIHISDRDHYKVADLWVALPKLFKESKNNGYQVIKNERAFIQLKIDQTWVFGSSSKTARVISLVSLSLDPDTVDSDFIQVRCHNDQITDQDHGYGYEGLGSIFKKWQADNVARYMDSPEAAESDADRSAAKELV